MTNEAMRALAERVVKCKLWRWMPGMLGCWETRQGATLRPRVDSMHPGPWIHDPTARPDLSDPATLGCLLALVREAWGVEVDIYEQSGPRGGSLVVSAQRMGAGSVLFKSTGGGRAERLVAALEAAPA